MQQRVCRKAAGKNKKNNKKGSWKEKTNTAKLKMPKFFSSSFYSLKMEIISSPRRCVEGKMSIVRMIYDGIR